MAKKKAKTARGYSKSVNFGSPRKAGRNRGKKAETPPGWACSITEINRQISECISKIWEQVREKPQDRITFTFEDQRCNAQGVSARWPGSTFTEQKVLTARSSKDGYGTITRQFAPHEFDQLIQFLVGAGTVTVKPKTREEMRAVEDQFSAYRERQSELERKLKRAQGVY